MAVKMTEVDKEEWKFLWQALQREKSKLSSPKIWDKLGLRIINNPNHFGERFRIPMMKETLTTFHDIPRSRFSVTYLEKVIELAKERKKEYKSYKKTVATDYCNGIINIANAHLRRKAGMHRKTWRKLQRAKERLSAKKKRARK